ncbi:MAG: hypothetical protein R3225_09350 [Halofilum sp. (in: g-proteobacteria)]|nr:hypothetical protein [Halofilum sp. (in: g-proteobacteria)]
MLNDSIHICHSRGEAHWLTPDPAWSGLSHGERLCIRDAELGAGPVSPIADAAAGAIAGLVRKVRGSRLAGA